MNLSKHVTLAEFIKSNTAQARGISNAMNEDETRKAKLLCEKIFEPLREWKGAPIKISSGFRSKALNKAVNGSSSSQHCKAEAMDLKINVADFNYIRENLPFDQLIFEFPVNGKPSWVHVSYSETRKRGQVLIAVKKAGKTVYLPYKGNENLIY